jgi:hypothetical protein
VPTITWDRNNNTREAETLGVSASRLLHAHAAGFTSRPAVAVAVAVAAGTGAAATSLICGPDCTAPSRPTYPNPPAARRDR